jgi:hypothetical protein
MISRPSERIFRGNGIASFAWANFISGISIEEPHGSPVSFGSHLWGQGNLEFRKGLN